jgi:hypothetical protein
MQKATIIRIAKAVGPWIPALLLVPIFIPSAWDKFSDAGGWTHAFRVWGYPDWFRVLIGVIELSAVALLVLGRTAALGAILIIVVMHACVDRALPETPAAGGSRPPARRRECQGIGGASHVAAWRPATGARGERRARRL